MTLLKLLHATCIRYSLSKLKIRGILLVPLSYYWLCLPLSIISMVTSCIADRLLVLDVNQADLQYWLSTAG